MYMHVSFYIHLCLLFIFVRIISVVEQEVAMETSQHSKDDELWTVYVDDLWSIALPHLREKGVYIRHLIFKKGHFPAN